MIIHFFKLAIGYEETKSKNMVCLSKIKCKVEEDSEEVEKWSIQTVFFLKIGHATLAFKEYNQDQGKIASHFILLKEFNLS